MGATDRCRTVGLSPDPLKSDSDLVNLSLDMEPERPDPYALEKRAKAISILDGQGRDVLVATVAVAESVRGARDQQHPSTAPALGESAQVRVVPRMVMLPPRVEPARGQGEPLSS